MGSKVHNFEFYSVMDTDTDTLVDTRSSVSTLNTLNISTENPERWYQYLLRPSCNWPASRWLRISISLFLFSMIFFVMAGIAMIPKHFDHDPKPVLSDGDKGPETYFSSIQRGNSSCLSLSTRDSNSELVYQLKAGKVLNLWCSISDKHLSENVTITWSFGNKTLTPSESKDISIIPYRFSPTDFISFLVLSKTTMNNAGDYYCSTNFPYEKCRQKMTVNIISTTTDAIDEMTSSPKFLITENDKLIFHEDFNSLNISKRGNGIRGAWVHEQGYTNFDILMSTHNTSYTKDGILYLKPVLTNDIHGEEFLYNGTLLLGEEPFEEICKENRYDDTICWKDGHPDDIVHPVMVPVLRSVFGFVYGKVEIRAQMPTGDWITPIISLIPEFSSYGKSNSAHESGLIQMVNTNGNKLLFDNKKKLNKGVESNCPALLYGTKDFPTVLSLCSQRKEGFDSEFHLYQLEWTPDYISLSIDGEKLVEAPYPNRTMFDRASNSHQSEAGNIWKFPLASNEKLAPFDHYFSLKIGLSIGGTEETFPEEYEGPYKKPWNNSDPKAAMSFWENRHLWEPSWDGEKTALKIDYIKIWELNSTKYSFDSLYL